MPPLRLIVWSIVAGSTLFLATGCGDSRKPPPSVHPEASTAATVVSNSAAVVPQAKPAGKAKKSVDPPSQIVRLELDPATFAIDLGEPGIRFTVRVKTPEGTDRDLTDKARFTIAPAESASIDESGYLTPQKPGIVHVTAAIDPAAIESKALERSSGENQTTGDRRSVARSVEASGEIVADSSIDFAQDVAPLFTRAGCNTGGCHGRADGQNGFHLSLFGYDPEGDYQAITRQSGSRRIDLFAPQKSLLLLKSTRAIPHVGGRRFDTNSSEYKKIFEWLNAGAPRSRGTVHGKVVSVQVVPAAIRLAEPGPVRLRVVARFADGHERDVTRLASYRTTDDSTVAIDAFGNANLARRGEADVVARYQSFVVGARIATVVNPELVYDYKNAPRRNFIDDELLKRLESLRVPPSPPASDSAFLRRVSLDLVGRQPDPRQIRDFLADTDPEKRLKLVDRLLKHRDFIRSWEIKFGDMLQITSRRFGDGTGRYQTWLMKALIENRSWDAIVKELLTALGDPASPEGGAVNYALDGGDAKAAAEQTAQRFLGLRFRCAQCHDHPFDIWTQDDYFGLAACFAKITRGGAIPAAMDGRTHVGIDPKGFVEHIRTHEHALPRLLDGTPVAVQENEDPRKALADWIVDPKNPYFAKAMANWTWAQLFGKGLCEPADDLSRANPPVHPELLDALARHFVAHKFDVRDLIRTIVTSEAYGLSSAAVPGNERDERLFSHHAPRPLTAYQMADTLADVTGVINRYKDRAAGTRAIEIFDPATPSPILDTFGRCDRSVGCSASPKPALSLRQALLLVGGDVVESKVSHLNGYLAGMLDLTKDPAEIVENLYMRTVCRPPSKDELETFSAELKNASSLRDAAEDLFWSLLNSREFSFNH
jgi:hypothetical protein